VREEGREVVIGQGAIVQRQLALVVAIASMQVFVESSMHWFTKFVLRVGARVNCVVRLMG
jgi:hypothetical protein